MSRHNLVASLCRPRLRLVLLLCLALSCMGAQQAAARTRAADAAPPTAVHYHLVAVLTGGAVAGTSLEGGVAGMLDATGVLTATVMTAIGETSTITGTLQGGGGHPIHLTLAGTGGTWSLGGAANKAGVLAGSISASGSSTTVGAWAMTPETASHTYAFVAKITSGPDRGTVESGTLATLVTSPTADSFDATYYGDDGSTSTAVGRIENHNLELLLNMTGVGVIIGSAPQKVETVLGTSYTMYSGSFVGPGDGDAGQWSASQTS